MPKPKVYSIQPRFKIGDTTASWSVVDSIFQMGQNAPAYASPDRDSYLAASWVNEPMTAGVFSTWVERAQTINWKVTGGRNKARTYAEMFNDADGGAGFSYHTGCCALDFLSCDKGSMEELGRKTKSVNGPVVGIQHVDATRMVRMGQLDYRWRFYPEMGYPIDVPDANIIQITSMASPRDRHRGFGYCAMSRLLDAKQLMLGYLVYYRQEIGSLPPELVVIINGLASTAVDDSLKKYKTDKAAAGLSEYGKIWWLGSDDATLPVSLNVQSLTVPNKSFKYDMMVEWWAKMLALNTGEDVGEFWLIQQSGATKAVQTVQSMKSRGKGVARFIQEQERRYNSDILPFGLTFEYDNKDDDQDKAEAEILGARIGNLKQLMAVGQEQQSFPFTAKEVRDLAVEWGIVQASEKAPIQSVQENAEGGYQPGAEEGQLAPAGPAASTEITVPAGAFGEATKALKHMGGMLRRFTGEEVWVVDRDMNEMQLKPLTNNVRLKEDAQSVYHMLQQVYLGRHQQLANVAL
jgi:hypothetical protein